MDFEDKLLTGIPFAEAASFFLEVRSFGQTKQATVGDLEAAFSELSPEERAEVLKEATDMSTPAAPALPATAKGMNMPQTAPAALPPAAMGQNKIASDRDPAEVGKERAHASLSAEFEKDKHHKGESRGGLVGKLLGGAAGAAAMHRYGKGTPIATLGGAALGEHLGGQVGKHIGASHDSKSYEKKHASAFKLALEQGGMPLPAAMNDMATNGQEQPSGQAAPQAAPPAPGGIVPQLDPATQEYVMAELEGQAAQETSEADYLRQKLEELKTTSTANESKVQMLEQQQQMHQQAMADAQAQIDASLQQATAAQDQQLAQTQAASAMRMAFQQLRGQVLQIASQDPPALSSDAAAVAAASAAGPSSAPEPQQGPAGQAASPGTPNTPAPQGDTTVTDSLKPNEPMFGNAEPTSQAGQKEQADGSAGKSPGKEALAAALPAVAARTTKQAALKDYLAAGMSRLPHAAAGAALGGAAGFAESRGDNEGLRQKVDQLEANPDRGFRGTASLIGSKARLTAGDFAKAHPGISAGMGALGGAAMGAAKGPALVSAAQRYGGYASDMGESLAKIMKGAA